MKFQITTESGIRVSYAQCDGLRKFSPVIEGKPKRLEQAPVVSVSRDIEDVLKSEARIACRLRVVMANAGAVALPMVRGRESLSILIVDLAQLQARQWIRASAPGGRVPLVLSGPELARVTYVQLDDPDTLLKIVNGSLRPLDAHDLTGVVMGLSRVVDDPRNLRELDSEADELREVVFTLFSPGEAVDPSSERPAGMAMH